MKRKGKNNIRLGLFVLVGVLLFTAALFFIGKQKQLFGSKFSVKVYYRHIEGLMVGNNVRFSGITVGTVDDIVILNDTTVEVTLLVQENVRKFIKTDSKAGIGSNGLMGDRIVNITPGTAEGKMVKDGATLPSIKPFSIDELVDPLRETAENAKLISEDLAEISSNIRQGKGTIGRLFTDKDMANDVSSTLNNINKASEKLDENMKAMQDNFLLRRYFKKKNKEEEEKNEDTDKKKKK